jgi:hypothetical protein
MLQVTLPPTWLCWFLSCLCFAVAYFPLRNAVGVLSTSTKSEGIILETLRKEDARGRFNWYYKVAYSVNGVRKTTLIKVSPRPDLKVGSPITLYYLKTDPNICVRGGFDLFGLIFFFGGFGLIFLVAGLPYFRSLSLNIPPEGFLIAIVGSFVLAFFYFGIRELMGAGKDPNFGEGVGLIIGGVVFGLAAFLAYRNMRAHAENVAESASYLESHYSRLHYSEENISALAGSKLFDDYLHHAKDRISVYQKPSVSIIMMGINSNLPIDNNEYYHIIPFRLVGSNKKSGGTVTQNLNLRTIAIYEKGTDELEGTVIIIPELNEYLANTRKVFLNRHKLMETILPEGHAAFSNGPVNIDKLLLKRSQLIEELAQWKMPPIIEFQKDRTIIYAGESTKDLIHLLEKIKI